LSNIQSFRGLGHHLDLIPAAINRQLSEIDIARGRQEAFARQHPAALESLKQVALTQSVEASNAIENITAPKKRIEELVARKTTPRNRSEAEIAGYRAVLDTIHSSAANIPFTPNIVRQLHRDLYQFAPQPGGNWKSTDNLVTEERADGSVAVRFRPVGWLETPAAMDELHGRFNQAWDADRHHRLLLTGAYVLDFLVVHPFVDGSGRMSRLLSLLLLDKGGYGVGRFVSVEKLIEQTKETYYDALRASTAGWHEAQHDLQPWLSYFLGVLTAAYREFETRAEAVTSGRGFKAELVKAFVRSNVSDNFTFAEVKRAAPGVSDEYIRQVLRELRDAGIIEGTGAGRGAGWHRLSQDRSTV
jgi:Fic family protein